ncbi:MAG TPA: plastocyanin/azurin family copper-binding protein [Longimicrobiaceae bacterium]|nr:plastocyanin/azurin family copper-binding protein [Longimicrobiaceae bacterium]
MRTSILVLGLLLGARALPAQSLLERSPNLQGTWSLAPGSAAFVFAHRFEFLNGGDELRNIPTLTLALGLPLDLTLGLDYTSNSEVIPGSTGGNATQYWVKRPLAIGPRTDLAGLVAYNTAADSFDGAINLRHRFGRFAIFGEGRAFSDLFGTGDFGTAAALGGAVNITQYLAITGDIGQVLSGGEGDIPAAWSGAVAVAIPGSPHTFSLQATNAGALTLQGASRKSPINLKDVRYGFVFTVPLGTGSRWMRIFDPAPPVAAVQPGDSVTARVDIRQIAFTPAEVRIKVGDTVEWVNSDPIEHTVTGDSGNWGSALLKEGERFRHRFTRPGTYRYHCTPHPVMTGVVIVEEG